MADDIAIHGPDDETGREIYDSGSQSSESAVSPSAAGEVNRPSIVHLIRSAAINMFLPFVNGLMLGFGEIVAHEFAFRLGWGGTRVFPMGRRHSVGPGVELTDYSTGNETRRQRREARELDELTSLE